MSELKEGDGVLTIRVSEELIEDWLSKSAVWPGHRVLIGAEFDPHVRAVKFFYREGGTK